MKQPSKTVFPTIVGLAAEPGASPSDLATDAVLGVLKRLPLRSSGVLLLHSSEGASVDAVAAVVQRAKADGISCRFVGHHGLDNFPGALPGSYCSDDGTLADASDLIIFLARTEDLPTSQETGEVPSLKYARLLAKPVIRVDLRSGELRDDIPGELRPRSEWLPELFDQSGLAHDAPLETVLQKMDALAEQAAPVSRGWWKWIILLQGLCVLVPVSWLLQGFVGLPLGGVAVLGLASISALVGVNWWLRWRGMQKTWARARLVAETARSLLATHACPWTPRLHLDPVPALRHLRWSVSSKSKGTAFEKWRDEYLRERIDHQAEYFARKQAQAERQRASFSQWATLLLDIALALAVAGAVIVLHPQGRQFLRALGGVNLEIALGIAGVVLPLALVLLQVLRAAYELNRRTSRFAQQREMLAHARLKLEATPSPSLAMEIVEATESQLLAEVIEWYFHVETTEHFFQGKRREGPSPGVKLREKPEPAGRKIAGSVGAALGTATLFTLRVVLGRVLWTVGAAASVIAWLAFQTPGDGGVRSQLRPLAVILDADGHAWSPSKQSANSGCVIVVHGLHDGILLVRKSEEKQWMQDLAARIRQAIPAESCPEIGLVDWHEAANPSWANKQSVGWKTGDSVRDLFFIRPQAQEVGDLLAFRLARLILDGTIRKDRPLHFVGHSAGGFVIARAALLLKSLGLAPAEIHLTILDTPEPDDEICKDLPREFPGAVDYYVTSPFILSRNPALATSGMNVVAIPAPEGSTLRQAHSYARIWFVESVEHGAKGEGFDRSPFDPR